MQCPASSYESNAREKPRTENRTLNGNNVVHRRMLHNYPHPSPTVIQSGHIQYRILSDVLGRFDDLAILARSSL